MFQSGGGEAAVAGNGKQTAALVGPDGSGAVGEVATEAGAVATAAALVAAADAGKLVDTSAPVEISLALSQKFGGAQGAQAGYMAWKQKIEATIGCKVPEDDGRRHALTLTVSDYKRRRGLL